MEDKKKIVLRQSEIQMCKLLAKVGLDDKKSEAEANGISFDYEAEKAKCEHEFIMLYAAEKAKERDWEDRRDKAFQYVISELILSTKLANYIEANVPDLKTFREMDPAEVLKVQGYGKKTADELREVQTRISTHPKLLTRINKAITVQRRLIQLLDEHRGVISQYNRLKAEVRHTSRDLSNYVDFIETKYTDKGADHGG
jgi:hypothetical protein